MTAIEASGLTVRRASGLVLDSVDLTVEESTVFGLVGPNGAGKSALLDCLTGRKRATAGRLRVYGLDPLAEGERLHGRTGVLRERVDLDARLNGWEHLHHATGGIDAPTDPTALLERVGVRPATARRPAETYSTGTARRVGLAMALVGDPDLLVVEEPTAGLDPSGVLRVRSVLREAAASETTLFLVARRWSAAFEGCDRIARLTDGRVGRVVPVGADGSPDCDEVLELRVDRVPSISLEGIPGVETVATGAGRVSAVVSDPAAKAAVVLEVAHADVAVEDIRVRPVGSLVGPLDEPKTTYEEQ